MRCPTNRELALASMLVLLSAGRMPANETAGIESQKIGETFELGGRLVTILAIDNVPYVDNEYTQRFTFDSYENPKLWTLRREYALDRVIEGAQSQFEEQLRLMTWAHEQFDFGDPQGKGGMRNALEILPLARKEQKFFCVQNAALLVSAAASMGHVCRPCGMANHTWTEMWSNKHRKWIFFDPTPGAYARTDDGTPLTTYEGMRRSYDDGASPPFYEDSATGTAKPARMQRYRRFSVIPNADWLDSKPQFARGLRLAFDPEGESDDPRALESPADAYFPINQASLTVLPDGDNIKVALRTLTPNFKTYQVRVDGAAWADNPDAFYWKLHDGINTLEAKSVNKFDLDGPVSKVSLAVAPPGAGPGGIPLVLPAISFTGQGGGEVVVVDKDQQDSPEYVHQWHEAGHWLEWTVENAAGGEYDLSFRYAARFDTERLLHVNGRPVEGMELLVLAPTQGWKAFQRVRYPVKITLNKGRNMLRLSATGDASLCLNEIELTSGHDKDITIPGRAFTGQGGGKVQSIVSDGGGFFYLWNDEGHWLEWMVDAPVAGIYDMYVHYATLVESPREVKLNGKVVTGLESVTLPPTGGWRYWCEAGLPVKLPIKKGENTLRMTSVGGEGLNVSAIRFAGPAREEIRIDAANFIGQGGGHVRTERPSRHGYFRHWDEKDHWIEWHVNAPLAGDYEMTMRYATKNRSRREVQVNGKVVEGLQDYAVEPTGDWRWWREATLPVPLTFKTGLNVLRLTHMGGGGLNLDEITLSFASGIQGRPGPAERVGLSKEEGRE